MDEIREYEKLEGSQLNPVKERLAFELTSMVHGNEEAVKAQEAARAVFSGAGNADNMPSADISESEIKDGMPILDLLVKVGLIPSKGEGRRLITQGGISVNGEKVTDISLVITPESFDGGKIVVKKGKKSFLRIDLK